MQMDGKDRSISLRRKEEKEKMITAMEYVEPAEQLENLMFINIIMS